MSLKLKQVIDQGSTSPSPALPHKEAYTFFWVSCKQCRLWNLLVRPEFASWLILLWHCDSEQATSSLMYKGWQKSCLLQEDVKCNRTYVKELVECLVCGWCPKHIASFYFKIVSKSTLLKLPPLVPWGSQNISASSSQWQPGRCLKTFVNHFTFLVPSTFIEIFYLLISSSELAISMWT